VKVLSSYTNLQRSKRLRAGESLSNDSLLSWSLATHRSTLLIIRFEYRNDFVNSTTYQQDGKNQAVHAFAALSIVVLEAEVKH
jgi:hypothetical protein